MEFEWDFAKSSINIEKHGLSFEIASEIFSTDPEPLIFIDVRYDYGEIRKVAIGSLNETVITVVYTERVGRLRLISARRSSREERKLYYDYIERTTTRNTSEDD
jgi:uncharacterized protein